ncbi:hypothetical protein AGMMS49992_24020 [Clostridia bacterium]|nr:hypothetical protein AGMMS49992_24020 [Clostridia bacterium]
MPRKKRANGEGTIYQCADLSFRAQYTAPNGKRKTIERKTQKKVQEALAAALAAIQRADYVEPSRMTVAAWLTEWLNTYAGGQWEHIRTDTENRDMFRLHILPYWTDKKTLLQKLTPAQCQAYVNHWKDMEYASATVHKRAKAFKAALEQAVIDKLIPNNPAARWKLPKLTQDEIKFMNMEQQTALKSALPDTTSGRQYGYAL